MIIRTALTASLCALLAAAAGISHADPGRAAHSGGIWKSAVPPQPMQGEFENLDPLGVEAGARIKADCSLNWVNPDDGKRYCFASGTSLEYFLDRPHSHLERAAAGWRQMTAHRD